MKMSQYTTKDHIDELNDGHAELDVKDVIHNTKHGGKFRISSIYYDKRKDCIMYRVMALRQRFDMFAIPECVVLRNIERDTMEVIER